MTDLPQPDDKLKLTNEEINATQDAWLKGQMGGGVISAKYTYGMSPAQLQYFNQLSYTKGLPESVTGRPAQNSNLGTTYSQPVMSNAQNPTPPGYQIKNNIATQWRYQGGQPVPVQQLETIQAQRLQTPQASQVQQPILTSQDLISRERVIETTRSNTLTENLPNVQVQKYYEPVHVVSKAPTSWESYKQMLKEENPISGSFSFLVEKGRGYLSKQEMKKGGQSLFHGSTGEKVAFATKMSPYFIPYISAPYTMSVGAAQFLTPGGRAETSRTAEELKSKYGVPQPLTKTGIYSLSALGVFFGGSQTISQTEKILGFPKYKTGFLGVTRTLEETPTGFKVNVEAKGYTEKTGLFSWLTGKKYSVSTVSTQSNLVNLDDSLFTIKTTGTGYSQPTKMTVYNPLEMVNPSGVDILKKPQWFSFTSEEIGSTKTPLPGEAYASVGKTLTTIKKTGKEITDLVAGFGMKVGENVISFTKIIPVTKNSPIGEVLKTSRSGQGTSLGSVKLNPEDINIFFKPLSKDGLLGSYDLPAFTKGYQSFEWLKSTALKTGSEMSSRAAIVGSLSQKTPLEIISKPLVSTVGAAMTMTQTQSKSPYWGTGLYERTETVAAQKLPSKLTLNPFVNKETSTFKPVFALGNPVSLATSTAQQQKESMIERPKETQRPREKEGLRERQEQLQRPRQLQRFEQLQERVTESERWRLGYRYGALLFPGFPTSQGMELKRKKVTGRGKNVFIPEIRRRGKFIGLGSYPKYETALTTGLKAAKTTLGASIRIKSAKGFIPFKSPTGNVFQYQRRKGRIEPTVLVQRRGQRLSSPFEISEIQRSRRKRIKLIR